MSDFGLLRQRYPLAAAAVILMFVWSGIMVLTGMVQVGMEAPLLGTWNIAVAIAYIFIGIGLLQRRPWAWHWGVWTNGINAVLSLVNLVFGGVPIAGLLLVAEVLILVFLVRSRDGFIPGVASGQAEAAGQKQPGASVTPTPAPPISPSPRTDAVRERGVSSKAAVPKGVFHAAKWIGLAVGCIVVAVLATGAIYSIQHGGRAKTSSAGSAMPVAAQASRTSSMSFAEFDAKFGRTLVDLPHQHRMTSNQRESARRDISGTRVTWEGIVGDVRGNKVLIRHRLVTQTNEVTLIVASGTVSTLNRGDRVRYSGVVSGFGSPYPYQLSDGSISSSRALTSQERTDFLIETEEAVQAKLD